MDGMRTSTLASLLQSKPSSSNAVAWENTKLIKRYEEIFTFMIFTFRSIVSGNCFGRRRFDVVRCVGWSADVRRSLVSVLPHAAKHENHRSQSAVVPSCQRIRNVRTPSLFPCFLYSYECCALERRVTGSTRTSTGVVTTKNMWVGSPTGSTTLPGRTL